MKKTCVIMEHKYLNQTPEHWAWYIKDRMMPPKKILKSNTSGTFTNTSTEKGDDIPSDYLPHKPVIVCFVIVYFDRDEGVGDFCPRKLTKDRGVYYYA